MSGIFDVAPQPPLTVKGIDEPISTYVVLRAKPRAFRLAARGIEGVDTKMIGREAELERLRQAFRRLCSEGNFAALTVVAEAGLGKSRLLCEFEDWIDLQPEAICMLQGRANPLTPNQPYGLLRDIVARRLHIGESDDIDAARHKIESGIAPLLAAEGRRRHGAGASPFARPPDRDRFWREPPRQGHPGGSRQIRNRAFHAAAQMFRHVAVQANANVRIPVVLQIEDLHWADEGSLDFLEHLCDVNRDVPMLMLCLSRPALFERRPDWGSRVQAHQRIVLGPLRTEATWTCLATNCCERSSHVPRSCDADRRARRRKPFLH